MKRARLDPMTELQNQWYNALVTGLLADPSVAQLIQPAPLLAPSDSSLWAYENLIPPASLTFNTQMTSSARFFREYASAVDGLKFPESAFEQDIGPIVYQQWTDHISQVHPPPAPGELPDLFFEWALLNAPEVAHIGASDLRWMYQISTAQEALKPYEDPNAKPADFSGTFEKLLQMLQASGSTQFSFDSSRATSDVSNSWTNGANTTFYGLWVGSNSTSMLSAKFARSKVTVTARLRYTVWISVPGAWYSSFLLNLAYSNKSSPPWPQNESPTWDEIFGPQGSMQRLIGWLLVADGLDVTVESDAIYSDRDQRVITSNALNGLWPFFVPSSGGFATNSVTFDETGAMRIEFFTEPQNPIVIGANVLGIARYLGHG
jgi:hypothetical protein